MKISRESWLPEMRGWAEDIDKRMSALYLDRWIELRDPLDKISKAQNMQFLVEAMVNLEKALERVEEL